MDNNSDIKPVWKFVIRGDTPLDVHGVGIREAVNKIVHSFDPGIKGYAKNLKGEPLVEIACMCNEDMLKQLIGIIHEKLTENPLVEKFRIEPYQLYNDPTVKFDTFRVMREDDLTEVVWALQNAGHAVLSQEKIRTRNLVRGVTKELTSVKTLIKEIDDKKITKGKMFRILSMESLVKEPPKDVEDETLSLLCDLYEACKNANNLISSKVNYENPDIIGYLDEIRNLVERTIDNMKGISEKLKLKTALNKAGDNI